MIYCNYDENNNKVKYFKNITQMYTIYKGDQQLQPATPSLANLRSQNIIKLM